MLACGGTQLERHALLILRRCLRQRCTRSSARRAPCCSSSAWPRRSRPSRSIRAARSGSQAASRGPLAACRLCGRVRAASCGPAFDSLVVAGGGGPPGPPPGPGAFCALDGVPGSPKEERAAPSARSVPLSKFGTPSSPDKDVADASGAPVDGMTCTQTATRTVTAAAKGPLHLSLRFPGSASGPGGGGGPRAI